MVRQVEEIKILQFGSKHSLIYLPDTQRFFIVERPAIRTYGMAFRSNFELYAFFLLQILNDLEQIACLRITAWPEHPHQTLGGTMRDLAQFGKPDCGVDEIAKDEIPGFDIARKKILNPLAQERLTKTGIALNARPDILFKISCQGHWCYLSVPFRGL
jgi:hypothetical protein